ncbi:Hypothetical protein NGAL_HAMBI2605_12410 [Neorhizobium galegae bv. orientalis]|nr:Hypothetical protein NGAL_HAMBI2605_12410 [Neorhizobium galegae bv. orientalis]
MLQGGVRPCQWMRVSVEVSLRRRTLKSVPASSTRPGLPLRSVSPKTVAALPLTTRVLFPMTSSAGTGLASARVELRVGATIAALASVFRNSRRNMICLSISVGGPTGLTKGAARQSGELSSCSGSRRLERGRRHAAGQIIGQFCEPCDHERLMHRVGIRGGDDQDKGGADAGAAGLVVSGLNRVGKGLVVSGVMAGGNVFGRARLNHRAGGRRAEEHREHKDCRKHFSEQVFLPSQVHVV